MKDLSIKKLDAEATVPTRAHPNDAGLDLYGLEDKVVAPGEGTMLRTGVAVAVPDGHVGLIADRSSLARRGLKTAGGVIDAGYRGELGVVAWNLSSGPIALKRGDRIAQLLVVPIATPAPVEVDDLGETKRGDGGFGSTGR
jgi:dUTP pyrophosphatase